MRNRPIWPFAKEGVGFFLHKHVNTDQSQKFVCLLSLLLGADLKLRAAERSHQSRGLAYPRKLGLAVAYFNHVRPLMALSGRGCYVYVFKLFSDNAALLIFVSLL